MVVSSPADIATGDGTWRETGPLELAPILQAALDALYENGFHGTPVRDIARRVGDTLPALYCHRQARRASCSPCSNIGR
jgi:hypothetical protein